MKQFRVLILCSSEKELQSDTVARTIDRLIHIGLEDANSTVEEWNDGDLSGAAQALCLDIGDACAIELQDKNGDMPGEVWTLPDRCITDEIIVSVASVLECAGAHLDGIESGRASGLPVTSGSDLIERRKALEIVADWHRRTKKVVCK